MDEAQDIILDWADNLDLELQNELYSEEAAEWEITFGDYAQYDIDDLEDMLDEIGYMLRYTTDYLDVTPY